MWVVFILYILYFDIEREGMKGFFISKAIFWIINASYFVTAGIAIAVMYWTGIESSTTTIYGKVLGVVSTICMIIGNAPQIWTTFRLKAIGALSLGTQIIQAPGAISLAYFQFVAAPKQFAIWLPYWVAAILGVILLVQMIFYEIKRKIREKHQKKEKEALLNGDSVKIEDKQLLNGDPSPNERFVINE